MAASGAGGGRMTRGARHAFIVVAAAVALVAAAGPAFTVAYANSTATRQDAAARVQDKTIAQLNATIAQLRRQQLTSCNAAADLGTVPLPARADRSRRAPGTARACGNPSNPVTTARRRRAGR